MATKPPGLLNPRLRRRLLLGLSVAAAATLVVLGLRPTRPFQVAEAKSYDLRAQWLADPAAADTSIVVIAIDENTLDVYGQSLGRWPWDRDAYDPLITYAAAGGARVIAFDLLFPEPDRRYPFGDTVFAAALADAGNGVLAFTLESGDSAEAALWERNRAAEQGGDAMAAARRMLATHALMAAPSGADSTGSGAAEAVAVPRLPYSKPPYPLLGGAARALGVVNWTPDPDGVTRRQGLVYEHGGRVYPSLPLAAARVMDPDRFGGTPGLEPDALVLGDTRIPIRDGRFLAHWHGPFLRDYVQTYRVIPAFHVLDSWEAVRTGKEPSVPLETFAGKAVFIAATAAGIPEIRATPVSAQDPGVMIHATILDNLLHGDFLRRAAWPANAAAVAVVALLAALFGVGFDSVLVAGLGALLALALATGVATFALARGVWLDMAAPVLAGGLAFTGAMVGNYLTEGREKRRVREMFGRYVSPDYVRRLADDYEHLKLGGERVPVTLLFSDIRGFTSLSEKLEAETVIEMLNDYLERMAEVVFRHGGTLDKFIGDAVMAFWNAPIPVPDHAERAVETALDMMAELDALNRRWQDAGAPAQLRIGIGVNTGEAIVGNIGSLTRKLDYTAIGDAVNLASRLEGLNKQYETSIIVSESTREALPEDRYELRSIDEVKVKGKEQAVRIYELRGRRPAPASRRAGGLVTASLVGALLALGAGPAAGQGAKARWTDWVYAPGAWRGAERTRFVTTDVATDSLALVARVELYARPPRWRAEFREVVGPDSLGEPVVLVVDGDDAVILTALGSTPLAEHAAADDPVVQAVVAHVTAGRPDPVGPTRVPVKGADGAVAYVILRKPAARAEFDDGLLKTGTVGRLGRSMARLGIHAVGGERRKDVVASAGARGVATVKTVDGEIEVMPDTAGILGLERVRVGVIELDRFLREAGIRSVPRETPKEEEGS